MMTKNITALSYLSIISQKISRTHELSIPLSTKMLYHIPWKNMTHFQGKILRKPTTILLREIF